MQVTLKKPHTHAGEPRQPGEIIDVSEQDANWLASHGVIEQPKAVTKSDSKEK